MILEVDELEISKIVQVILIVQASWTYAIEKESYYNMHLVSKFQT